MGTSEMHKAFIISPIGGEGSDLRQHADWVRKEIIEKACERVRSRNYHIIPVRSDDKNVFAHVTDEMMEDIVEDRVVFVVLGGNRANCYFELGIAVAAGRPVIILTHDAEEAQFDTKDYRTIVTYRLPERQEEEAPQRVIQRVADAIELVMQEPLHRPVVHNKYNPLGRDYKEWKIYSRFRDIDLEQYSEFFRRSNKRIGLQGITLGHFSDRNFRRYSGLALDGVESQNLFFFQFILAKILFDACDVTILMMHQNNPALPHLHQRLNAEALDDEVKVTKEKIRSSYRAWMNFKQRDVDPAPPLRPDGRKGSLTVVQARHGVVHYRLSFTEKEVILSPYINAGIGFTGTVPAIRASAATQLFEQTVLEFDDLVDQNLRLGDVTRRAT